jgi:flavodoxin I
MIIIIVPVQSLDEDFISQTQIIPYNTILMKTGIFYGSTYGNTQEAGEQLVSILGTSLGEKPEIFDIHSTKAEKLLDYDLILVGVSTWNDGEVQDDWDDRMDDLEDYDFNGKFVALLC